MAENKSRVNWGEGSLCILSHLSALDFFTKVKMLEAAVAV